MTADALRRRDVLAVTAATAAFLGTRPALALARPTVAEQVIAQARALAAKPYVAPSKDLPPTLAALNYDAYRDLRFQPPRSLWRDLNLPFEMQMFHRGGMFRDRVELFEAVDGRIRPIRYSRDLFDFGPQKLGKLPADLGFAGFRIHAPINNPDYFDEIAAFLGASYFRGLGKGDAYGLSARGLALGAGEPREEFPIFRSFILERPAKDADSVIVHALLDGPSVAGAYSFAITPGAPTKFDTTATLFPRRALDKAGIAPLTSMYLFGPEQPRRFDDFRPEVHDSDGLAMVTGEGRGLWRALDNPAGKAVRITSFPDNGPKRFGLLQRQRDFGVYQDLEANYHQRPSAWVEPIEGFGAGEVRLIEIPAKIETDDNIGAFWRPAEPMQPGREHRLRYVLNWGVDQPGPMARVLSWREGLGNGGGRRFVIEFDAAQTAPVETLKADIDAGKGVISDVVVHRNAVSGGIRLSFELQPGGAENLEVRAGLLSGAQPVTETFVHPWTA